jgi:ribosomal protein S18 acetylase RimI-like enzyme
MERYFRQNGCDVSRVEVFEPNVKAHAFYQKLGYHDRMFDMIKKM